MVWLDTLRIEPGSNHYKFLDANDREHFVNSVSDLSLFGSPTSVDDVSIDGVVLTLTFGDKTKTLLVGCDYDGDGDDDGHIFRSTDDGATFTKATVPTPTDKVHGLFQSPVTGTWIAACGDDVRSLRSTDDGITWAYVDTFCDDVVCDRHGTFQGRTRIFDVFDDGQVILGDSYTRSTDDGSTWSSTYVPIPDSYDASNAAIKSVMYVRDTREVIVCIDLNPSYILGTTIDGGDTWSKFTEVPFQVNSMYHADGVYVGLDESNTMYVRSTNGVYWDVLRISEYIEYNDNPSVVRKIDNVWYIIHVTDGDRFILFASYDDAMTFHLVNVLHNQDMSSYRARHLAVNPTTGTIMIGGSVEGRSVIHRMELEYGALNIHVKDDGSSVWRAFGFDPATGGFDPVFETPDYSRDLLDLARYRPFDNDGAWVMTQVPGHVFPKIRKYGLRTASTVGSCPKSWFVYAFVTDTWVLVDQRTDEALLNDSAYIFYFRSGVQWGASKLALVITQVSVDSSFVEVAHLNYYFEDYDYLDTMWEDEVENTFHARTATGTGMYTASYEGHYFGDADKDDAVFVNDIPGARLLLGVASAASAGQVSAAKSALRIAADGLVTAERFSTTNKATFVGRVAVGHETDGADLDETAALDVRGNTVRLHGGGSHADYRAFTGAGGGTNTSVASFTCVSGTDEMDQAKTASFGCATYPRRAFVSYGGSERITIDDRGYVGISTGTQDAHLDVAGNVRSRGRMRVGATAADGDAQLSVRGTIGDTTNIAEFVSAEVGGGVVLSVANKDDGVLVGTGIGPRHGRVGVCTSDPKYTLHVDGDIYATGSSTSSSDARYKTDMEVIERATEKIKRISGYTYVHTGDAPGVRRAGLIAQELREVLPEAVREDDTGRLSIAYGEVIALVVEAIKELAK